METLRGFPPVPPSRSSLPSLWYNKGAAGVRFRQNNNGLCSNITLADDVAVWWEESCGRETFNRKPREASGTYYVLPISLNSLPFTVEMLDHTERQKERLIERVVTCVKDFGSLLLKYYCTIYKQTFCRLS